MVSYLLGRAEIESLVLRALAAAVVVDGLMALCCS